MSQTVHGQNVTAPVPAPAQRRRRRPRSGAGPFTYLLGALVAVVYLAPLALVLLNSVKTEQESKVLTLSLPSAWQFQNYLEVLTSSQTKRYLLNSVVVTTGVVVGTILVAAMAAFVIARRPTRLSRGIYTFLLVGMIAPFAFIPAIRVLQWLHLYGTFPGLILVDIAGQLPFITMIYVGFIRQLPTELDEAARIDGCGDVRLFLNVIFPLLRPVTTTGLVLLFTAAWNDFQNVLFLMPDSTRWTMPMSVYDFQSLHSYNYALVCADMVITIAPVVLVYLVGQKYIISGMTSGAVKS